MPHVRKRNQSRKLLKMTDKHAAKYSNAAYLGVNCIYCSYKNIARSISLLDKTAILFVQVNFHTSKSF